MVNRFEILLIVRVYTLQKWPKKCNVCILDSVSWSNLFKAKSYQVTHSILVIFISQWYPLNSTKSLDIGIARNSLQHWNWSFLCQIFTFHCQNVVQHGSIDKKRSSILLTSTTQLDGLANANTFALDNVRCWKFASKFICNVKIFQIIVNYRFPDSIFRQHICR